MPKNKTDNRNAEIKMDDQLNIQTGIIISGIYLILIYLKNDCGTNPLFQVLGEKQLEYIFKLAEENLKMPVLEI